MIEKVQNKRGKQKSEWNKPRFKIFIYGSHATEAITSVYQVTVTLVLEKNTSRNTLLTCCLWKTATSVKQHGLKKLFKNTFFPQGTKWMTIKENKYWEMRSKVQSLAKNCLK